LEPELDWRLFRYSTRSASLSSTVRSDGTSGMSVEVLNHLGIAGGRWSSYKTALVDAIGVGA
jgi:hypothetical protein